MVALIYIVIAKLSFMLYAIWWFKNAAPAARMAEIEDEATTTPANIPCRWAIVIPARNEVQHLPALLLALGTQIRAFANVEIWVVDDYSTDGMAEAVSPFLSTQIHLLQKADFPAALPAKKGALTLGIAHTKADFIVCLDADVLVPNDFIIRINHHLTHQNPDVLCGKVTMDTGKKLWQKYASVEWSVLQALARYDASQHQHGAISGAFWGYRKNLFEVVNGFAGITQTPSGDDELLLAKLLHYNEKLKIICPNLPAVRITPEPTFNAFYNQRMRWAGKHALYTSAKQKTQGWLGAYMLLLSTMLVLGVLQYDLFPELVLLVWLSKSIVEIRYVVKMHTQQPRTTVAFWVALFQPLQWIYIATLALSSLFRRTYTWKGVRYTHL